MSKTYCFGCLVEKDLSKLEIYPFDEDCVLKKIPIVPLMVIDCQGPLLSNNDSEFRMVVVCHKCCHKLNPDMWIGKSCWESISPSIPYDKLPMYVPDLIDISLLQPLY